ncbi:MAG: glycosyltransferase [Candidatus Paceibacteria bacterium]
MSKRILYVITKANWGGAQRYVFDLATAAATQGYEVAVAYGSPGELASRLHKAGIPTFEIAGLGRDVHLFKDSAALSSLLEIYRSYQPDVVHLNSSKIGGIGALAARLSGVKKIVFTAHAWAFNEDRPRYQKAIIAILAWITVLLSTETIVVSEAMKEQMYRWPFMKNKLIVITNGSHPSAFLDKRAAREALIGHYPALAVSDTARDIWIGTVAELHPVKGLSYAIDAMQTLRTTYPTIRYVILGEGQLHEKLEKQIRENDLEQTVFLLGHVPEAPGYGKAYDLFLLPSLSESFGIAILEAGLAELPVVAAQVGGIPEIITSGETGVLVPPKDPTAIAHAIDSLLTDEPRRNELGSALREKIEKEFTIERVVRETFARY